ncbi:MAG: hypothetical protein QOD92_2561 [Acidimicrobiaceae bacterium]|jgi:hypothetical protein
MANTVRREARRLVGSAKFMVQERGFRFFIGDAVDLASAYVTYPFAARKRGQRTFSVGERTYHYATDHYNRGWRNERAVELALGRGFLADNQGRRLLEVGNVLAHYGVAGHDVLDKYEDAPNVINDDIVDFTPEVPYEAILSISTLEHVGWDEKPREPDKTLRAYHAMRAMLAPGGTMLLTCPIGQNSYLDEYIQQEALEFPERHYLLRVTRDNVWREVELSAVRGAVYHHPYRNANALFVGIVPAS